MNENLSILKEKMMKLMACCVLSGVMLCPLLGLRAQTAVEAGVNVQNFSGLNSRFDAKSGVGLQVGVRKDFRLFDDFILLGGVRFSVYNNKQEGESYAELSNAYTRYKNKFNASYLEIPVAFGYNISIVPKVHLTLYTGPSFNFGLGGKLKATATDLVSGEVSQSESDMFGGDQSVAGSRFGLVWNLGARAYFNHFLFGVEGSWELTRHSYFGDDNNTFGRTAYTCFVGYAF